jgi:hypothetical protein
MDYFRLAFGFLMFHRRTIIGILLLIGLYYFITDVVPRISKSQAGAGNNGAVAKGNADSSSIETDQTPSPGSTEPEALDSLLKSNDLDKLIKELMRLKDLSIVMSNDAAALVVSTDISKLSSRILEMELDLAQRKYVLAAYSESLLMRQLINIDTKSDDAAIEAEFQKTMQELLGDRDSIISSFAAAALISTEIYEFNSDPTEGRLRQVEAAFNSHYDKLTQQTEQLLKTCQVLVRSKFSTTTAVDTKPFLNRLMQRLAGDPRVTIQQVGKILEGALVFRKLGIENLAQAVRSKSAAADRQADQLIETLQRYPDTALPNYQIAIDAIREYYLLGELDRGNKLADLILNKVLPKRDDQPSKEDIKRALNELVEAAKQLKRQSP